MAYIITRLCRDCVDTACVAVCPVDCIYRYTGDDKANFPNQLYIHPDECIDCGACEPECPWQAIFEEAASADRVHRRHEAQLRMLDSARQLRGFAARGKAEAERRGDRGEQEEVGLGGVSRARPRGRHDGGGNEPGGRLGHRPGPEGRRRPHLHLPRRCNSNIEDIEQRVVEGLFIMTMVVDLADVTVSLDELILGLKADRHRDAARGLGAPARRAACASASRCWSAASRTACSS